MVRALAVGAVLLAALPAPALARTPATAAGTRCSSIVVDRPAGKIRAKAIVVRRTSCRTARDVARRVLKEREDRPGSRRYRRFLCDLISDRQMQCDRGRSSIRFELGAVRTP